jgi:hypothetical protein
LLSPKRLPFPVTWPLIFNLNLTRHRWVSVLD